MGHEVLFHDLCEEGFDPVLTPAELARGFSLDLLVQEHCGQLAAADGLLIFHPDWWGQPPAVLKGWLDRVFRQGVAYDLEGGDFSEKEWKPLLAGRPALVMVTTDATGPDVTSNFQTLWTELVLGRCGMDAECRVLTDLRRLGSAGRAEHMASLSSLLEKKFGAVPKG
jgi:putative NADPH-quinone reductase